MITHDAPNLREERWCALLLGVWSYALFAAALRIGVHVLASPFASDWSYRLGCIQGIGTDCVLGLLVGLAFLIPRAGVRRTVVTTIAFLLLAIVATGAHYHAIFNRLPAPSTLHRAVEVTTLKSSIDEHAPFWLLALEAFVPALLTAWGVDRLASRIAAAGKTRRWLGSLLAACVPFVIASGIGIGLGSGQIFYGSIGTFSHVLLTREAEALVPPAATREKSQDLLALVQARLAVENAGPPLDAAYPYCGQPKEALPIAPKRSAILLILEAIDERTLYGTFQGKPIMPYLQKLTERGVHFVQFQAAGYQSNQARPAILSGLPAVPLRNLMQHAPLAHLRGIAGDLRSAGFLTGYFHGSDLSFEQQRAFLKEVGFEEVFEPSPLSKAPMYGWGEPDGPVLDRLRAWVTKKRVESPERPYFATAFTLSTHDPYVWPPDHQRRFEGDDVFTHFAETASYLDEQLWRFYQWYEREEMPRGTALLLTGDHAPRIPEPTDATTTSTGEFEYRFRVPLMVFGLTKAEQELGRVAATRIAGHQDIPQTVLGLTGVEATHCYQGRNLFSTDPPPEQRWTVSVAGESLEFVYVHDAKRRWMLSLKHDTLTAFDPLADPMFRAPLAVSQEDATQVRDFLQAYLSLNRYLIERDKFAPPEQERAARPALSRVEKPSLMTRSSSSAATPTTSNGITEVEAAIAAGFPWVSLEVELTSDLVPVLSHDSKARTREGTELKLASKTLRELENTALQNPIVTLRSVVERFVGKIGLCLELKRQEDIFQTLGLARETIKVLASLPPDSRIVLDSSSHTILATLEEFSHWPLGYDLPRKNVDPAWLDFAAERSFDWVYVDGSFITADAIRRAHQLGLKVMMLDVHDPALLGAIGAELPDGIRTDTAEPWQTQSGKNWLKP